MYLQTEWKTVDPDQKFRWLRQKQADLDLRCFQKWKNLGSAGQGLIKRLLDDNTKKNAPLLLVYDAFSFCY